MVIDVPEPDKPKSILDGITMMGIDTDPDSNLALALLNFNKRGDEVLAVIPRQFSEFTRGYIVVVKLKEK